jgi:predicted DNA binding CopG/RHH family protein
MGKLPRFKTAQEEGEFWETHSPLDFPDEFEEVKEPVVDRRPRKKGIYIRIDPEAINAARNIGADLGIGYQTLFRIWIMEGLSRNLPQTVAGAVTPAGSRMAEAKVADARTAYDVRPLGPRRGRRRS